MLFVLLSLVAAAATGYYYFWRSKRAHMYELAEKIPGPGLPVIGMGHYYLKIKNHHDLFRLALEVGMDNKYKDLAKVWFGPKLTIILVNPQDIELVLGSNVHLTKSPDYKFFEPWFGNGLLISSGDEWKAHRKMIAPTFHLNVLRRFFDEFNIRARSVCNKMGKEEGEFDCHEYMSECTVETLIETVMGVKEAVHGKTCYDYAMAVMEMCDILHLRQTRIWLRPESLFRWTKHSREHDFLLNKILSVTNKVFKKKKEDFTKNQVNGAVEMKKDEEKDIQETNINENFSFGKSAGIKDDIDEEDVGEKKRLAFLESMIDRAQSGDGLTDQEIKNQVNTIMFEGHDTTAAGSSFFLCVMAALPDMQDKCREEVDRIFGDSDRPITFQDTLEMKFLERCIMETLRLFPPVPIIAREIEKDMPLASNPDLTVPAGSTVVIGTFKLHRQDYIYNKPDEFNPDNFLPENSANRHFYSFIPFSAGPRSCVGRKYAMLKLKVILAEVLRQYRVTGGKPMADWKLQADIILKRTDGFNIRLEPRRATKAY